MFAVLSQMAVLLLCGIGWRILRPFGSDADTIRQAITTLVFVLLLPALVLQVLWQAPLGRDSLWIAIIAASGVLLGVILAKLLFTLWRVPKAIAGTLILAAGWPNATYLGLPVLEQTLGSWARSVAIQYDLFACTPLLLTLGILIARAHGEEERGEGAIMALLRVPPLWAALLGVALNLAGVEPIPWVDGVLDQLATAVIPLMLIAVGMGLRWDTLRLPQLTLILPVALIQLLITPLMAMQLAATAGLDPELQLAITLEAAMPVMVLGVVLCDRYRLDAGLYAAAVTVTTLLALLTLPLWLSLAATA